MGCFSFIVIQEGGRKRILAHLLCHGISWYQVSSIAMNDFLIKLCAVRQLRD